MVRDGLGSQATPKIPSFSRNFLTPLLPLLTVRQVAHWLGVCTAIVYRLCDRQLLRHVRILNAIRVAPDELGGFHPALRAMCR